MRYKNKYLASLGLSREEYGIPKSVKTGLKEKKFIREYGFHPAECWSMDIYFCEWLYSHLMKYKEDASNIVDLKYHKFTFEGKEYTQLEAIDKIIEVLGNHLLIGKNVYENEEIVDPKSIMELAQKDWTETQKAIKLFAEIFPAMWW